MSTLENLRQQLSKSKPLAVRSTISSGSSHLNKLFPHQGIRPGSIIEWVGQNSLCEAALISLVVMKHALTNASNLLLLDPSKSIYPHALVGLGFDLNRVLYVNPNNRRDLLWACDLGLRCSAIGVVLALQPEGDAAVFRRFQIAAEDHDTIGSFVFDHRRLPHRCWGDVRLGVESLPRGDDAAMRFRLEVLRSTRGNLGDSLILEMTSQGLIYVPPVRPKKTYSLRVVSSLGHPATRVS